MSAPFEPKDEEEAKVYEELKELFQFYDTDGSGELGVAEVGGLFLYFSQLKKNARKGMAPIIIYYINNDFLYSLAS